MLMVWYDEIFALAGMHYHDASAKVIKKMKVEKSYKSVQIIQISFKATHI